ncbi:MAG: hypothetical protein WEB53_02285 [Akkermansiaceae bacterium]
MPRVLLVEDELVIADTLVYALGTNCFEVTLFRFFLTPPACRRDNKVPTRMARS